MKVGIVSGGFKPFHSGHFSKVALSLSECDRTLLLYSTAPREDVTTDQLEKMWNILSPSLSSRFTNSIVVKKVNPWPLSAVYGLIKCSTRSISHNTESERLRAKKFLSNFGIDEKVTKLVVYGSQEDLDSKYISYINKGQSLKMFDTAYDSGILNFDSGGNRLLSVMKKYYPGSTDEEILSRIFIRATQIRSAFKSGDFEHAYKFLPPEILSSHDKETIVNIFS